ncbi:CLUMA_CG008865, isoform A [Clunio marinus]|uniref:CLUMA_CG008865, isoform A n=1 Tax=Clunio marinus TaxID=568069 RepID=A0A1J1I8P2_9DIPT|nr:CLUMA_CG008865, isoform A [Clunio marinus]
MVDEIASDTCATKRRTNKNLYYLSSHVSVLSQDILCFDVEHEFTRHIRGELIAPPIHSIVLDFIMKQVCLWESFIDGNVVFTLKRFQSSHG